MPAATLGEVDLLPSQATDHRISIGDTATFLAGAHMIKIGGDYNDTGMDGIFKPSWRGTFIFASKEAFLNGKWSQYIEFLGLNGNTADQAGTFDADQKELAFFAQDQWYLTSSLTITAGLRYERLDNPNDPVLDAKKVLVPGAKNVRPDVQIPDANYQWSPRLSVAWSPGRNAKSVVRLALGRYWSRTPEILFTQLYSNNGVAGATYQVNASAIGPTPGVPAPGWGPSFDPNAVQQLGSLPPGTSVGPVGVWTIAPDFRNPHTDRISLGAEREFFGVAWGLEGVWAKGYDLERLNDPNLLASPAANCPLLDPNSGSACYGALSDFRCSEPGQPELRARHGLHVGREIGLQGRHAVVPEEFCGGIPVLRLPHARLGLRHRRERAELSRLHPLGHERPRAELGSFRP